jgi:hypothetical protein
VESEAATPLAADRATASSYHTNLRPTACLLGAGSVLCDPHYYTLHMHPIAILLGGDDTFKLVLLLKLLSTICIYRHCVHTTKHCVNLLKHQVQTSTGHFEPWLQRQYTDMYISCSVFLTCVTGQNCCNISHLSFTSPTLQHTIAAGDARTLPISDTNHLDITITPSTPGLWGLSQLFILSLTAHHQHHQFE